MEKLFENRYTCSKEHLKEFYSFDIFKKGYFRILKFVIILYSVVVFSLKALSVPVPQALLRYGISFLISYYIVMYTLLFAAVEVKCMQFFEVSNGKFIEVNIIVEKDRFVATSEYLDTVDVSFDNIKKVRRTKNYCILCSRAKSGYAFKNDSFTYGNFEDFLSFLRSKGFKC